MTQMQYLQFFADKEELLEPFDDAERGRLFSAMLSYALHCEEILLTGNERFVWPVFRQMIDQSRKALDNKSKGGSARQQTAAEASRQQQEAAEGHINQESRINNQESRNNNQESRNKNNNGGDKHARAARFTPPSVADVISYAAEIGLTLDAQKFCDFYASKGWRVGNTPMKDWRASARNWARRDQPSGKSPPARQVTAQQYAQREYSETELAGDFMDDIIAEARHI